MGRRRGRQQALTDPGFRSRLSCAGFRDRLCFRASLGIVQWPKFIAIAQE